MARKTDHPEYGIWNAMISRCHSEKNRSYSSYGGKGIKVCARWREKVNGFDNFVEDMGPRPSLNYQIHRGNPSHGYTPKNCSWIDKEIHKDMPRRNYKKRKDADKYRSTSVHLIKQSGEALKRMAKARDRSVNWLINRAITKLLESEETEKSMVAEKERK